MPKNSLDLVHTVKQIIAIIYSLCQAKFISEIKPVQNSKG